MTGGGETAECASAVTIISARLPHVRLTRVVPCRTSTGRQTPGSAWSGFARARRAAVCAVRQPLLRPEILLAGLDYTFPSSPKMGGLASGATSLGLNALFLDEVFTKA